MSPADSIQRIAREEGGSDFACPQCGACDQIDVLAKLWVRIRADGGTDPDLDSLEHEWSYESEAICSSCGYSATAGAFKRGFVSNPPDG